VVSRDGADGLHARIRELEAELAGKRPEREATLAPRLLEHDPGLPRRMDSEIASRLVRLIRDYVPVDGGRDPESILDEVLSICRAALIAAYGPGEPMESLAPA